MKKHIITYTVLVFMMVISSCSEDVLEIPQQGVISQDEYYANATDDEALALIAYIYKQTYTYTGASTSGFSWISLWGGLAKDVQDTGGVFSNVGVSSVNHPGNELFAFLYRVNYLSNLIIEKLEDDSPAKSVIIGEAYFWRAWAYTYLTQVWGNPPLIDHILGPDELKPGNAEKAALWNYVETSLNEAIQRLPEKPSLEGQSAIGGRVTKHSAYALLGKAQLWSGDEEAAISTLETVINSGLYGLIDDYSDLIHVESDYSKEYMWEWNIEDSDQANYTFESDGRGRVMAWRSENINMPNGMGGNGFGIASTYTKDFYDFMIEHGEEGKARYLGTVWDYENVLDKFIELEGAANREEAMDLFWNQSRIVANSQGYMRAKMYIYEDEVFDYTTDKDRFSKANWPGMRYAEVLLNYAEACASSGMKPAEGLAALNEVRTRAGLDMLGTLTLQDVKDEKRAELVLEGDRFLDLIRWGDAATELAGRGDVLYNFLGYEEGTNPENGSPDDYLITQEPVQGSQDFIVGRDELFPYPYSEILLNENLEQNPGWQ